MSQTLKIVTTSIVIFLMCSSCGSQEQYSNNLGKMWTQFQPIIVDTIKNNSTKLILDSSIHSVAIENVSIINKITDQPRIIGLGEPTHGTKESTRINIFILKSLIQNNGLRHICFEGDIVGGITLNNYILGRTQKSTDYNAAFAWLGIYDTDFANFIEWLKTYNTGLAANDKVQLYGLGYLYRTKAIEYIMSYVKQIEPEFYDSVKTYYQALNTQLTWEESRYFFPTDYDSSTVITLRKNAASVVEHLEANQKTYFQKSDSLNVRNIIRLAVSIGFSLLLPDPRENDKFSNLFYNKETLSNNDVEKIRRYSQFLHQRHRDYCLFTNFQAVFKEIPDRNKIAVWGHNLHIGKRLDQNNKTTIKRLGFWLNEKYGKQYSAIGYIFYQGKAYTQIQHESALKITTIDAQHPPDGSIENFIQKFTSSNVFINIQSLNKLPISQEQILMRSIGSQYDGEEFIPTYVTKDFDALIFLQKTTPSQ